jgi:hypothetical protein
VVDKKIQSLDIREDSNMAREKEEERENRIHMEIVVDAYGPEEQALGWYYSLENGISFPFRAQCMTQRATSPLEEGEEVTVVGMPPEEECRSEMFVLIEWEERTFGVPLAQLEPLDVDEATAQIIEDWHYWVERGYRLC